MSSELDDQSQFFRDLYRLTTEELTTEEKVTQAIDIGRDRLGVRYGLLSYTGGGEYEVLETNITSGKYSSGSTTDLETTWCRHVVADRELIAIADAESTRYADDIALDVTGLQCYIGVPIIVDGETFGTLCYSDEESRDTGFTESEEQFVTLLGSWVGREIEREKHYRELQRQNERLDEFTGVVAHDLRNPLAGAIGYTEMALDETTGEVNEFLQRVDRSLDRMESMIGECLLLAKEGTDVGRRESVEIAEVVRDAWNGIRTRDATIDIAVDGPVLADRFRLQRMLENLFRNSVEHGHAGVTVTVTGRPDGFAIRDDGPGIPDDVMDALESDDAELVKRLGLGLLIVQRIVSGHGWELTVESSDDGTTFEVTGVNTAPNTYTPGPER